MNYQKLEELTVVQEAVDDGPLVERSKKMKKQQWKDQYLAKDKIKIKFVKKRTIKE